MSTLITEREYSLSDRSCHIMIDKKIYNVDRSNACWPKVVDALNNNASDEALLNLISPAYAIQSAAGGENGITVTGNVVYWRGEAQDTTLAKRLIDILQAGLSVERWVTFMENVYRNPFLEALRTELYPWMEQHGLTFISSDGCFYAFKWVNNNYTDCHTGKVSNKIGEVVWMEPDLVDKSRALCSSGFHFCSKHYGKFGTRLMIIKINPADVVSIPVNAHRSWNALSSGKGRCWRYEVVDEVLSGTYEEALEEVRPPVVDFNPYDPDDVDVEDAAPLDPTTLVPAEPTDTDEKLFNLYLVEVGNKGKTVKLLQELLEISRTVGRIKVEQLPLTLGTFPESDVSRIIAMFEAADSIVNAEDFELPTIETLLYGTITRARFEQLLEEEGSIAGIARKFNMSAGTISGWKRKLYS